uniref:U1740b n=1 Tax=Mycobacterium leprae TaxID=1769 RepID=Q50071_MYCLR|nr:u1740b [Mycobacterium leprae]
MVLCCGCGFSLETAKSVRFLSRGRACTGAKKAPLQAHTDHHWQRLRGRRTGHLSAVRW